MASPTSWLGTSAAPLARMASSTCWASCCSWSSSTGRPWQARRTPATTFERLNGSLTPLRLTTARTASSTVVNRRPQAGHERRRRVVAPSSASRESITRLPGLWQKGQRTAVHLLRGRAVHRRPGGWWDLPAGRPGAVRTPPADLCCRPLLRPLPTALLWTSLGTSGGSPGDELRTTCGGLPPVRLLDVGGQ